MTSDKRPPSPREDNSHATKHPSPPPELPRRPETSSQESSPSKSDLAVDFFHARKILMKKTQLIFDLMIYQFVLNSI